MSPAALAKALRRRQLRAGLLPKSAIHAAQDAAFIDCYLECSRCRQRLFATAESERMAIALAENAEHFVQLCQPALSAHRCPAAASPYN